MSKKKVRKNSLVCLWLIAGCLVKADKGVFYKDEEITLEDTMYSPTRLKIAPGSVCSVVLELS